MIISLFKIGWIVLVLFQIAIAFHFYSLYKIDKDKRKLMFTIAFLIGVFSISYNAMGFHNTANESILLRNIYYWSSIPIPIAIFSLAHHNLLNLKKLDVFFKSFLFFTVLSFLFLILFPANADEIFSPIFVALGFEILIVSLILFIKKRKISDLIFLFAVLSFMTGGMATSMNLEEYFQIFSFFIGYIFIFLIFAYPLPSKTTKGKGGMSDIFRLQRKLTETTQTLQKTQERYHDLFETIKSGVAVYEAVDEGNDYIFIDFNSAAERIENITRDQVIGKRVTEMFPGIKNFGLLDVFKEVWENGGAKHHPVSYYQDDRTHGWRDTTVYKVSTGEIVAVYDDVTKEKQKDFELRQAHHNLKKLNRELDKKVEQRTEEVKHLLKQKEDFINQLGHDLKTPLGPLISLLPIIEKTETDPKKKQILQVVNRNVGYMKNLVIKTIELASLSTPSVTLDFENTNLYDLIQEVIDKNRSLFEKENINIENNVNNDIYVYIDKLRIKEVVFNLLNNAVKYNNKMGSIYIDAKKDSDSFIVAVQDTGIGLTVYQMEHIFDEFYKVDESRHDFKSSGLGISICKKIVEKHKGHIWVESPGVGKGSTFYFSIPKINEDEKQNIEKTNQNSLEEKVGRYNHEIEYTKDAI